MATKQIQIFFDTNDEAALSQLIKDTFPDIHFLDSNLWPDELATGESIEKCKNHDVYLYRGELSQLPTGRRKNGWIEGPNAGCVVQVLRSREKDGTLFSGRIAVGYNENDQKMKELVAAVWRFAKQISTRGASVRTAPLTTVIL